MIGETIINRRAPLSKFDWSFQLNEWKDKAKVRKTCQVLKFTYQYSWHKSSQELYPESSISMQISAFSCNHHDPYLDHDIQHGSWIWHGYFRFFGIGCLDNIVLWECSRQHTPNTISVQFQRTATIQNHY